jgi:hypothetical protein
VIINTMGMNHLKKRGWVFKYQSATGVDVGFEPISMRAGRVEEFFAGGQEGGLACNYDYRHLLSACDTTSEQSIFVPPNTQELEQLTRLWAEPSNHGLIPSTGKRYFFLHSVPTQAMKPTQPPFLSIIGNLPQT